MRAPVTTAAAGLLVLVGAGLTGCGRSSTLATGTLQVTAARSSLPPTGGEEVGRTFVTPHFSVTQQQVAAAATVTDEVAQRFGLAGSGDREAPEGAEIVLVTLRGKGGGLYPGDDVVPTVTLHAGERDAPVDDWPTATSLGGVALAAVVARDAPVELRVVDDGRTVAWDLREGRYAGDPVSQASAVLADAGSVAEDVGGSQTVSGTANLPSIVAGVPDQSVAVGVTVDSSGADARITPWLKGPGWAPDDTVWLYLTGLRIRYDGRGLLTTTVAEPTAAFTLTPAAGAAVAAYGTGVTTSSTEVDVDGAQVAFNVPAGFRGGTLAFTPQATIRAVTVVGGVADVTWTSRPPAASVPLDLEG